jgi:rhodanese-related sulfurtransferase
MFARKFLFKMTVCAMLVVIVACGAAATPAATNSTQALPSEISVQEASKLRDQGAFVLDVREQSEWNEFHIPNTTLIPLGQLAARAQEVPKDKSIVVVCRSGNRSATGRDILKQAGFKNVTSVNGGVTEWRKAGYPTVSGP